MLRKNLASDLEKGVSHQLTSFNGKAPYFSAGMRVLGIAAIFTYPLDFA